MKDVVRTVVSEALGTYLTTPRKLHAEGVGVDGAIYGCGGAWHGGIQAANVREVERLEPYTKEVRWGRM